MAAPVIVSTSISTLVFRSVSQFMGREMSLITKTFMHTVQSM